MLTLDERIAKERKKLEQLKRQKRAQKAREQKRLYAVNKDRWCIIGKIVEVHFPQVLSLQPYRTEAENKSEFAPLEAFFSELASDKQVAFRLRRRIEARTSQASNNELK